MSKRTLPRMSIKLVEPCKYLYVKGQNALGTKAMPMFMTKSHWCQHIDLRTNMNGVKSIWL